MPALDETSRRSRMYPSSPHRVVHEFLTVQYGTEALGTGASQHLSMSPGWRGQQFPVHPCALHTGCALHCADGYYKLRSSGKELHALETRCLFTQAATEPLPWCVTPTG